MTIPSLGDEKNSIPDWVTIINLSSDNHLIIEGKCHTVKSTTTTYMIEFIIIYIYHFHVT